MAATGTNTRLPIVFRAKVSGLNPNSTYRYYVQGTLSADFGTSNSGSGMSVLINSSAATYVITSSPGLSTAGAYETFTTDASGTFTGWFGMMNTTGTRFTAGNEIFPTLTLNNGNNGTTPAHRFALDQAVKVITIGTTAGANFGTGIWGTSSATDKNIVALYDNTSGAGKPLAMTYVEDEGVAGTSQPAFYSNNVNGKSRTWGTLIPNVNANGVRKIEQFSLLNGSSVGCATDADGIWPTGNRNTVNPTGGTTAIQISEPDAPLDALCGNSVSRMSDISASNTFSYPENINYMIYQENNNISLLNSSSVAVASFDLRDGGGTTDADTLGTTLTSVTFNITNSAFIRRAALYSGSTELAETVVNGSEITFSGFSLTASDNNAVNFTLRVSYTQNVTDNAQNIYTIIAATAINTGSGFAAANAGGSASATFGDYNRIEVIASKLSFTVEPAANATVNKILAITPVLSARDNFNNTDLDFTGEVMLSNTSNIAIENTFANMQAGMAGFPLMLFNEAGTTSLTANTNGLSPAVSAIEIKVSDAKKWTGAAGTNLWNDAQNWTGNSVPTADDAVILDNTFTGASYNVMLPDFATAVTYLRISPADNKNITFTLPATNIACPGFTVGDNSAGTEDFVIENGGIFINANGCANAQGFSIIAQGSNKAIKINAGGKYIHRNSKSHTEFLDAATWDENSNLTFDVVTSTAYSISLANRNLGGLTLLAEAKNATQAYSSNFANTAVIKGDLTTETRATLALSGHGNLAVGGNIINRSTFSTGNTNRKLVLNGTKAQNISGTGAYTIKAIEINNAEGVTLQIPVTLSNTVGSGLFLTEGNLNTSATNILTLPEYATINGGGKLSFVNGPVAKTFGANSAANIILPTGKDTSYRPVTITPESLASASVFRAEYFNSTVLHDVTKHDNSLENINGSEYWNIQRTGGTTNASLAFDFTAKAEAQSLRIVNWDGAAWKSVSQNNVDGVISTETLSQFGTFALGTQKIVPLPVSWLYFTTKMQDKNAVLNWATVCEINNHGFEIQRSTDGENYETIGWMNGNGTSSQKHFYSYTDMGAASINASIIYYRLKQVDFNGAFEYSAIQSLRKKGSSLSAVSIYTDAQKCLHIQLNSEVNATALIEVINMNGQVLQTVNAYTSTGNNNIKMHAQPNMAGVYVVRILQNGTIYTQKIVL